jgi:hypothetical protein
MGLNPSRQDRAAHHLEYEIESLVCMWMRVSGTQDAHTQHALLEASLGHARLLIEFLIGRPKNGRNPHGAWGRRHQCDIRPTNFLNEWNPPDTAAVRRLKDLLSTLDQSLVHLSWERATPPGKWDATFVEDLVEVVGSFVAALEKAQSPYAGQIRAALEKCRPMGSSFDTGVRPTTNN